MAGHDTIYFINQHRSQAEEKSDKSNISILFLPLIRGRVTAAAGHMEGRSMGKWKTLEILEHLHLGRSSSVVPKLDTLIPSTAPTDPDHEYRKHDPGQGGNSVRQPQGMCSGLHRAFVKDGQTPITQQTCKSKELVYWFTGS